MRTEPKELKPLIQKNHDIENDSVSLISEISSNNVKPLLRWMSYRMFERNYFTSKDQISVKRRFKTVFLFSFVVLSLLLLSEIGLSKALSYSFTKIFFKKSSKFVSCNLSLQEFLFSTLTIGLAAVFSFKAAKYASFLYISNHISRMLLTVTSLLFLLRLLVFTPTCWITSFHPKLSWICHATDSILWLFLVRSYSFFQLGLSLIYCFSERILKILYIFYYALMPLQFITGISTQCHLFKIVSSAQEMDDLLQTHKRAKKLLDRRLLKFVAATFNGKIQCNSDSRYIAAFAVRMQSFPIYVLYATLKLLKLKSLDSQEVFYFGQVDHNKLPDGVGQWIDMRKHGERIIGIWKHGFPIAPFHSYSVETGTSIIATQVFFGFARSGYIETGIADIEVCLSENQLDNFPKITRLQLSPSEDNSPQIQKPTLVEILKLRKEEPPSSKDGVGILWCLNQMDHRAYASVFSGSGKDSSKWNKAILFLPPHTWTFEQNIKGAGCFYARFGHEHNYIMTCFSHHPDSLYLYDCCLRIDNIQSQWNYSANRLQRYIDELSRHRALHSANVIVIGSACGAFVEMIPDLKFKIESISLILPIFRIPLTEAMQILSNHVIENVTIYTTTQPSFTHCGLEKNVSFTSNFYDYLYNELNLENYKAENFSNSKVAVVDITGLIYETSEFKEFLCWKMFENLEFDLLLNEELIHDIHRVIVGKLRPHDRAPNLRETAGGIWEFYNPSLNAMI